MTLSRPASCPASSSVGFLRDQRAALYLAALGQELGLDLGGIIDTRRHAVGDQFDQRSLFALRRVLQQGHQFGGLLLDSGSGDTEGSTFSDVGAIGFARRLPLSERLLKKTTTGET